MRKSLSLIRTLALLPLLAACATRPPPAIDSTRIDTTAAQAMQAAHVPGLALAVIEDGRVVYQQAYGFADVESQRPLTTDTIMYGASLTKAVFAYMVAGLVREGVIDLDAPLPRQLKKPLPDYEKYADLKGDERWRQVTPRMLLSHSSGLLNWRWINEDKKLDFKFDPGSRYVYSGEGIAIMQLVVEERTGRPVEALIQERVFDRFGMRNSSLTWRPDFAAHVVTHYGEKGERIEHDRRRSARAAGSMDTTLEDMAKFLAGVLNDPATGPMLAPQIKIVSPQQFPSHWPGSTDINDGTRLSAALGWIVFKSKAGPAFFKEGADDGTQNLMLGLRDGKRGIVMLSNSSNARNLFLPMTEAAFGPICLPWFWMGYVPYDRPDLMGLQHRDHPVVSAGCR
ncbi:serine hydrolase domain-containing protein [Zemynaea arenosa]|nr:serine hydrolase domain-containing protein [Massilia arenosa]